MKETEQPKDLKPVEIVSEQQQEKKLQIIGRQNMYAGQFCWEYNMETGEIKRAALEPAAVNYEEAQKGVPLQTHRKLIIRENCLYAVAINAKNAAKKFVKIMKQNATAHA